jgi:enoyl-[acyl-carrier protein] reductase II
VGHEDEATAPPNEVIGTSQIPTPDGGVTTYPMPKFSALVPTASTTGNFEEMCLPAGESASMVKDIQPVATIIKDMMGEAKRIIRARLFVMSTGESRE